MAHEEFLKKETHLKLVKEDQVVKGRKRWISERRVSFVEKVAIVKA